MQVTLSLDVATYGLQFGTAQAALVQTAGSQGATAMLNNNLAGRSRTDPGGLAHGCTFIIYIDVFT